MTNLRIGIRLRIPAVAGGTTRGIVGGTTRGVVGGTTLKPEGWIGKVLFAYLKKDKHFPQQTLDQH